MKLIGLDVGTKRIGVAKADSATKIAVPDGYINVNGQEFAEIARLARMYNTTTFIVGLPRNNNGEETKQSLYARNFARQLAMSIPNARIYFEDESLTSVEAERRLKERKKKFEKGEIDSEAASIILQDFLERLITNGKITESAYTAVEAKAENDAENSTKNTGKKMKKTGKKSKVGLIVGIILGVILVLGGGGAIGAYFWYVNSLKPVSEENCKFATAEEEATSKDEETVEACIFKDFKVSDSDTASSIAVNLKNANLIKSDFAFKIYVKLNKSILKSGDYKFRQTQSTEEIVKKLVEGAAATNVFNITILPGETVADVKTKLKKFGYLDDQINEAFEKYYDHKVLKGLYSGAGTLSNAAQPLSVQLEGYIFGDTYQFYNEESLDKIIETTLNGLYEVVVGNDLEAKYAEKGLTLREGIILASIVQKEAKSDDMPGVAQVFLNRLRVGMALGSDVTATYAADLVDPGRQTLVDNAAILAYDSLYNTRVHTGIPPGPISNPGVAALMAVANPDTSKSSMYFFLTGDDGKMYYSDTVAGHNQNVRDYCRTLCGVTL